MTVRQFIEALRAMPDQEARVIFSLGEYCDISGLKQTPIHANVLWGYLHDDCERKRCRSRAHELAVEIEIQVDPE